MANINDTLDHFLHATLWLWLPFYALFALLHELLEVKSHH